MALEEPTASNSYCYHDQLTNQVNKWINAFFEPTSSGNSLLSLGASLMITAGAAALIAAGGPVGLAGGLLIGFGTLIALHTSGLFDDPLNPVNWLDFAATVGSAVFFKAPIGAAPFKILTSEFCKKYVKGMVFRYGNRYIVKATLGCDAREAIENTVKSWIKGSGISTVIHSPEQVQPVY